MKIFCQALTRELIGDWLVMVGDSWLVMVGAHDVHSNNQMLQYVAIASIPLKGNITTEAGDCPQQHRGIWPEIDLASLR